jgi:hypothetical protein
MKKASALLIGLLGSAAAMADTATDTAVTTAMTSAGTSVATYGAALVTLALVGVGFAVGIKYIRKIPRVS